MEDREKQFLTTLGAWAHMQNQKRNTAELQKQNRLLAEQAKAEADRTKIEQKRLQLEIEQKKIDDEIKGMVKEVRKEMVSIRQSLKQIDTETKLNFDKTGDYSEVVYDLGILCLKVGTIKDKDILSDLNDLEYLAKLEVELEEICANFISIGLSKEHPVRILKKQYEIYHNLANKLSSLVTEISNKTDICEISSDDEIFDKRMKIFEKELNENMKLFEKEFNENSIVATSIPEQISAYESYKTNNCLLGQKSDFKLYLQDRTSFKNKLLTKLSSLRETQKKNAVSSHAEWGLEDSKDFSSANKLKSPGKRTLPEKDDYLGNIADGCFHAWRYIVWLGILALAALAAFSMLYFYLF